jgi:hypothetical protein
MMLLRVALARHDERDAPQMRRRADVSRRADALALRDRGRYQL